jgi:ribosomal protein S18 acetylase RimI-like enzyme
MKDRVHELLLMGSSPASVDRILKAIETTDSHFLSVFPKHEPNAVIAYREDNAVIEILDIAVDPAFRRQGLGSLLINEMIARHSPERVIAETDDDAVDFYRKLGFHIAPFQSKWGITRYSMDLLCS